MNKKTKIVVLHLKELVYTGIFVILGILFVVLLMMMFSSDEEESSAGIYTPGRYTTSLTFGGSAVDVSVTVNSDSITSISLENLEESVSVMYPLMEPTLEELSAQILETQSLDNLTYAEDNQYTSLLLMDAIAASVEQARRQNPSDGAAPEGAKDSNESSGETESAEQTENPDDGAGLPAETESGEDSEN